MSNRYDVIALSSESTVVAEYLPDQRKINQSQHHHRVGGGMR